MFSTEISLGFLWIIFFFSATADFPMRFFFFFQKRAVIVTRDALVCICFMTFWHIFGDQ